MITIQEAFDRCVRGLRSQGWTQSLNEFGGCVYQGHVPGTHCAYGWIDSKQRNCGAVVLDLYNDAKGDATNVGDVMFELVRAENEDPHAAQELLKFMAMCQRMHDGNSMPAKMERTFRETGERLGLTWPDE